MTDPISDHTMNPGRYDYWTCCACYEDLGDIGEGEHICPHCDHKIECTQEDQPVCHTRLAEAQDED